MIEIKNMSFQYNTKRKVLKNINLTIQKGDWVAILGHNGSGKSTLAKTIVGLLQPTEGEIFVNGVKLSEETLYEVRNQVGIVFQNPDNQFVGVTVRDDIAFGMENLNIPREQMLSNIEFFAQKIGLTPFLDKEPATLSGGQKQRVAIAGILAMNTKVMIFDEATSMLDPYARAEVMDYIKQLNLEGLTVIMITHDIEEAMLAQKMVILKQGEILAQGNRDELLKQPHMFKEARLELPASLEIYYQLLNTPYMTKELEDALWAFGSSK
ncbi:MAG: energy-coupling factor transporter ATPase [Candidatus Izemoplasmatales bacterium]|jgi:energy-coupling factor transport system ATP-binding protein|nr:energy-coupling factor transporter ATPase [bacterium]MDZ4197415.1 energy-coupling factor transporter ATPase [Candidatus Izemoplasmatales bacterium]